MNMPFLTMQALLGTDKRPPELPADDSEPGRLTQAIAATRDGSENAEALRLLRAAGVQAVCGAGGVPAARADSALPSPARRNPARPSTRPPSSTYCAKSFPAAPTVCALKPSGSCSARGKCSLRRCSAGAGAWAPHAVPARAHRPDRRGTRPLARRTERRMEPLRHQCRKRA